MTREQFEAALVTYGGDFRRWPSLLVKAAEEFVARDLPAASALRAQLKLDALLAHAVQPLPVDAATVGRIIAGISARHERANAIRPTGRLLAWAGGAMAVFLVVGFVLGLAVPSLQSDDDDAYAALLFGPDTSVTVGPGDIL
jgi:hypothetical protein